MFERSPIVKKIDDISMGQYAKGALNLRYRWQVYEGLHAAIDFYKEAANVIGLKNSDTLLDVGCGDGLGLWALHEDQGYSSRLIGMDISKKMFEDTQDQMKMNRVKPVDFIVGLAQELPFPNHSIDKAMALFMLYHVPQPEEALVELVRVLKPGGLLAIATSGKYNKPRHREFEKSIAYSLWGVQPPPVFAESFDAETSRYILPDYFAVLAHYYQAGKLTITDSTIDVYLNSLLSMKPSFIPSITDEEWERSVHTRVEPVIRNEIAEFGSFRDTVERHLFICRNDFVGSF